MQFMKQFPINFTLTIISSEEIQITISLIQNADHPSAYRIRQDWLHRRQYYVWIVENENYLF